MPQNLHKGFTLIELLVTLMILTLLLTFAYRTVNLMMQAEHEVAQTTDALLDAQKSLNLWARDLRTSPPSPQPQTAQTTLTTRDTSRNNRSAETIHSLTYQGKHIDYILQDQKLWRSAKDTEVNSSSKSPALNMLLLTDIETATVEANQISPSKVHAIDLNIESAALGHLKRVIYLGTPNMDYFTSKKNMSLSGALKTAPANLAN